MTWDSIRNSCDVFDGIGTCLEKIWVPEIKLSSLRQKQLIQLRAMQIFTPCIFLPDHVVRHWFAQVAPTNQHNVNLILVWKSGEEDNYEQALLRSNTRCTSWHQTRRDISTVCWELPDLCLCVYQLSCRKAFFVIGIRINLKPLSPDVPRHWKLQHRL